MKKIAKYLKYGDFWGDRADFFRDVADSLKDKELFRDFLEGEMSVCDKRTARYRALKQMRLMMQSGERDLSSLLACVMPSSDALALAVLHNAFDKEAVLLKIADSIELEKEMAKILTKALLGPLFLISVCAAFVWVMVNMTIPAFEAAAPAEVWVGFPWLVRAVSEFLRDY
ncbi:MAG: hypothetical protein ACOVSV_01895, partial [Fimbriimonadaceae bacterium]